MRINGEWVRGEDGEVRATIGVKLLAASMDWIPATFLIDTGADRTVLSSEVIRRLGRPAPPSPRQFGGVGGAVDTVLVFTKLQFTRDDGGAAFVADDFPGFLDPAALDTSVLGLDVLKNFSLILDHTGRVVCLLRGRHRYVIQES